MNNDLNKLNTDSVMQLLNRSSAKLDLTTLTRLGNVRMQALARYDARSSVPVFAFANAGILAGAGQKVGSHCSYYFWASAVLLVALLFSGAAYWQHVSEPDSSEVDLAILTDDLPMDAYVD